VLAAQHERRREHARKGRHRAVDEHGAELGPQVRAGAHVFTRADEDDPRALHGEILSEPQHLLRGGALAGVDRRSDEDEPLRRLRMPRGHFDGLRAAGGEVGVFRPFFSLRRNGPRNLRNHRKATIADDQWLWCGGRNLAGEYFLGNEAHPVPWLDLSFDLRGSTAAAAARQFDHDWASIRKRKARGPAPTAEPVDGPLTQYMPSGPDQTEDTALALLVGACFRAEHRFLAVTPYFVPGDSLRDALRLAARRGVQVTIAMPAKSNHSLADFVRARAMRDLARAGVTFRMLPFMVHAKAVVVDEDIAMCGSINLDLRSLLLNHEASVLFYGQAQIDWLAQWMETIASAGEPYRARRPGLMRDLAEGLLLTVAFQL